MFQRVAFVGLLALGYSTFASTEDNNINYLDLIDTAEPAPVGPLDEECARKYGVQDRNLVFNSSELGKNGLLVEPITSNSWHYTLCLAKKRGLLNGCGSINDNHIQNWQKDIRSLGLFDDDFVNRINSTCHQRDLRLNDIRLSVNKIFQSDEPEALGGYFEYIGCLINMLEEFYDKPERKKFEEQNDNKLLFQRSPNVKLRTEKALHRIILKTPDTP